MYGRTFWGAQRTTYVLDAEGKGFEVLPKVKPGELDAQVLAALAKPAGG